MPSLSVIIPTHNRAPILRECLARLEKQTIVSDIEVIVVSDGHDPDTAALFAPGTIGNWKLALNFFEIPKSQQGVARNEGVNHAKGKYVLFIGDDIFLEPDACELHLKAVSSWQLAVGSSGEINPKLIAKSQKPIAVLGHTTWDPAVGITPVMEWLEKSGWQFGYPMIQQYSHAFIPPSVQHQFTYTSHISLPFTVAKNFSFRTDVHLYGWEDIEWGMQLRDAGVRLFYEPHAKALHHHHVTVEQSLQRMETLGASAVEIAKNVPTFDRVPRGMKAMSYRVMALLPTMSGKHRKAFLRGLRSSQS